LLSHNLWVVPSSNAGAMGTKALVPVPLAHFPWRMQERMWESTIQKQSEICPSIIVCSLVPEWPMRFRDGRD